MKRWIATASLLLLLGLPVLSGQPGTALASTVKPLIDTSTGWGGYYLAGAADSYNSVSAAWTVPTARCVTGDQEVAFWVGLDGVTSASIEQIGMDEDCTSGTAVYYGWYEMYPADPVYFSNTIAPGDAMSASVKFSGTDTYTLVLSDTTQSWTHTVTQNEAGLPRSSAEVITSGPAGTGGSAVLTDFGQITYTRCTVNGTSMGTQDPTGVEMVDSASKVMISTSPMTAAGTFVNTWLRGS